MSEAAESIFGGHVEPGYKGVQDAFVDNFVREREHGAAFCLHVAGRKVVDIWGGFRNREQTKPYDQDTLQLAFSTTKGATAMCANLLAQRGELDVHAPVSSYWPEFAQAGKDDMPVLYLLTHQAGLPAIDRSLRAEEVQAWDPVVEALAGQVPFWEPGTAHGYHALTYGWLVGEVVRRISGRSVGTYFAEEIAGPLGVEFWIGLPEGHEHRVAPVSGGLIALPDGPAAPDGPASADVLAGGVPAGFSSTLLARALNVGGAFGAPGWANDPAWHAAEVPAANGITNAASLSRLYAGLIGTVEGGPDQPLLTRDQIDQARAVRTSGSDQVFSSIGFAMEQKIGLGFWISSPFAPFGGAGSFGHAGAGGSYGFADPENDLAVGYVMNRMGGGVIGDPRARGLVKAVYAAIGQEPKYF
jgi:CubicO group peptidase (beta-lactamase class C family)